MAKKTSKPAIVWASNHPLAPSGYGTQTAQVVSRLRKDYAVAIAANYGTEGFVSEWRGCRVFPKGIATHSEDVLAAHVKAWGMEHGSTPLLITLYDVWIYQDRLDDVERVASWVPIDHVPAPAPVLGFLSKPNVTPIAMSRFGQVQIQAAGIESLYVPHGLESVWKPTATYRSATGRELMRVPEDAFVITINQANKADGSVHRKAWPENLAAATEVLRRRSDAWLYVHTESTGSMGGLNVEQYLRAINAPLDRVRVVDQYAYRTGMPAEAVAAIYTASDVLLACSMGEGFGLTPLEAQACGTPVVVSDWTAQPELVGDGWIVGGQPFWHQPMKSWWLMPDVDRITDALLQAVDRGRGRSVKAIDFAKGYAADRVWVEHWLPALEVLAP